MADMLATRSPLFAAGITSAADMYLGVTIGAGSSGGIIDCDNLFVMIGARQGEMSFKFNFR